MSSASDASNRDADAQLDAFLRNPTHAVLLGGGNDITATTATNLAAQLLNVESLENHAYYRVITPEKGTISIEQIRELITFFRLKVPGSGAIKRVAILQETERMGIEAQNALLKVLEEPPVDSVLILTSPQPQNLLPTIRSRVQIIHLSSPSQKPEADMIQLVKQVLSGAPYERLLLVDGLTKKKEEVAPFVSALATVAMASLEAAARKGSNTDRWQTVLQSAYTAQEALSRSGNTKLVLTELMLAM